MSDSSKSSLNQKSDIQTDEEPQPLPEEYLRSLQREESEEEEYTKFEECLCSFFDQEHGPKPTLEEYQQDQLRKTPLFSNILILDKDEGEPVCIERPSDEPDTSILVTGFGIRNLRSLQQALQQEERKRLYELYKAQKLAKKDLDLGSQLESSSKKSIETETEMSSVTSGISVQQERVRYLMGLQEGDEEEGYPQKELLKEILEKEDKFIFAQSSTMKSAQMYLRTHRIFDFFRYIITHLLSAAPENPIVFILVLLNKILLYRSGNGPPPLLYEKKHVEQLFKLMDRMDTGFIDINQYTTGMNTLGICEFNKEPLLSGDGMVSREVFIREVLGSETILFNDLIKKKWTGTKPMLERTFSSITSPTRSYISGCHLFPSDILLQSSKQQKLQEDEEEG